MSDVNIETTGANAASDLVSAKHGVISPTRLSALKQAATSLLDVAGIGAGDAVEVSLAASDTVPGWAVVRVALLRKE